jgi:hypothetical protein
MWFPDTVDAIFRLPVNSVHREKLPPVFPWAYSRLECAKFREYEPLPMASLVPAAPLILAQYFSPF